MKQIALLTIVLMCLSLTQILTAQNNANTTSRNATITVRGCITGGKRYTFIKASTGDIFALKGNTDNLQSMVGKLVELKADEFPPQGSDFPQLQVKDAKIVGDKCPIQGRGANTTNARQKQPASQPSVSTPPYEDPGTVNQAPPNVNNPNITGDTGAPSPGTDNPPPPPRR